MTLLEVIQKSEYIDFQKVDDTFSFVESEVPLNIHNEIMLQRAKGTTKNIEYFDQKGCLRIPRGHIHSYILPYSACYSIFFYLHNNEPTLCKVI